MKYIIVVFLMGLSAQAQADQPFFCALDGISSNSHSDLIIAANYQCSSLDVAEAAMDVLSITVEAGSLISVCTAVGAPVTVVLQGAALGIHAIRVLVGNLPCAETDNDEHVRAVTREAVCAELIRQGLTCNL